MGEKKPTKGERCGVNAFNSRIDYLLKFYADTADFYTKYFGISAFFFINLIWSAVYCCGSMACSSLSLLLSFSLLSSPLFSPYLVHFSCLPFFLLSTVSSMRWYSALSIFLLSRSLFSVQIIHNYAYKFLWHII